MGDGPLSEQHTWLSAPGGAPAVFLDRDGVLTEPIYNPLTDDYESPHDPRDVVLCGNVMEPLRRLRRAGFSLFIVSNQPSFAKGKTTLERLQQIAHVVDDAFRSAGVTFEEAYYCYHHPQGVVPEYSGECDCRKPKPAFLLRAAQRHKVDLSRSWMIGDRDSDVECGRSAGCRTILVLHPRAGDHRGASRPDFQAADLAVATDLILTRSSDRPNAIDGA
jgi:D-glycero-D-manno-heptose 1,7-bisphosphate phosphatase